MSDRRTTYATLGSMNNTIASVPIQTSGQNGLLAYNTTNITPALNSVTTGRPYMRYTNQDKCPAVRYK